MKGRRFFPGLLAVLVLFALDAPLLGEAGSLGKAVGKGAARGIVWRGPVYHRPWGSVHRFRSDTWLERWTNRPHTDKRRGLPPHSFWKRPEPGRKGSARYVREKLNIPHPIKRREEVVVKRGTPYHERPIKGGHGHSREVIVHPRVPGKALKLREAPPR